MNQDADQPQGRWPGRLFVLLMAGSWVWTGAYLFRNTVYVRDPYIYGDWLINYGGGFARRGLGGEILTGVHRATGLPTDWLLFVLLGGMATALFGAAALLLRRTVRHVDLPVLFAPAGMMVIFSLGNVGRKDLLILLLTLAGGAAALAIRRWPNRAGAICGLLLAALPVAVLIHEGLLFYLPAIILPVALMLLVKRSWRAALLFAGGAAVLAVTPFLAIMAQGASSAESVAAMCARTLPYPPLNCGIGDDAIGWMQRDLHYAIEQLADLFRSGVYPQIYVIGLLLGCAYVAVFASQFRGPRANPTPLPRIMLAPWLHVVLFALATAPLYLALDWGRWLAMWLCQSVLYLLLCERAGLVERRGLWLTGAAGLGVAAALWGLNLFWSVPICCNPIPTVAQTLLP